MQSAEWPWRGRSNGVKGASLPRSTRPRLYQQFRRRVNHVRYGRNIRKGRYDWLRRLRRSEG